MIFTGGISEIPLLPGKTSFIERYACKNIGIPFGVVDTNWNGTIFESRVIDRSLLWTTAVIVFLEISLIYLTHHNTLRYCEIIVLP